MIDFEVAIKMMEEKILTEIKSPRILKKIENIDIRQLNQIHTIPNMGVVMQRGIWFPLG